MEAKLGSIPEGATAEIVADLARKAAGATVIALPAVERGGKYAVMNHATGELKFEEPSELPINAEVGSVEALADFIKSDTKAERVRIFFHEDIIHAAWQDSRRTRQAKMPLPLTQAFKLLLQKAREEKVTLLDQQSFWILLKKDFGGMINPAVIAMVKNALVKLNAAKKSEVGSAKQVKESTYSMMVESGGAEFPEEIVIEAPVYDVDGHRTKRYQIPCTLIVRDIQCGDAGFALVPRSIEVAAAQSAAVQAIVNELAETAGIEGWTVLKGKPVFELTKF